MLLQHNNTMTQTNVKTQEAISQLGWLVLSHPSYSPGLAPSDFHLFRLLKDAVHGRKSESDDDVLSTIKTWLYQQDKEWYCLDVHALAPHWHIAIELHTEVVEN
jgi:histone-lysine N-methyltransferase SETMAR